MVTLFKFFNSNPAKGPPASTGLPAGVGLLTDGTAFAETWLAIAVRHKPRV